MRYIAFGDDATALSTEHDAAVALYERINAALGYTNLTVSRAIDLEPRFDGNGWAVQVLSPTATVWSWTAMAQVKIEDFLTEAEKAAILPWSFFTAYSWAGDANWWGETE